MKKYLEATPESGKRFYLDYHEKGKVTMLNLLKFKTIADYSGLKKLKPASEISGQKAYDLYMDCTQPHLEKAGSRVVFFGESKHFLIGPDSEEWDAVLLVEHKSVTDFMKFAQNESYLAIAGHRTAALSDARLLPISEKSSST